jgi:hypothetical protein
MRRRNSRALVAAASGATARGGRRAEEGGERRRRRRADEGAEKGEQETRAVAGEAATAYEEANAYLSVNLNALRPRSSCDAGGAAAPPRGATPHPDGGAAGMLVARCRGSSFTPRTPLPVVSHMRSWLIAPTGQARPHENGVVKALLQ